MAINDPELTRTFAQILEQQCQDMREELSRQVLPPLPSPTGWERLRIRLRWVWGFRPIIMTAHKLKRERNYYD